MKNIAVSNNGPNEYAEHFALLSGAFIEGIDLGSRSEQICQLGTSLQKDLLTLSRKYTEIEALPVANHPLVVESLEELRKLIDCLRSMIDGIHSKFVNKNSYI